MLSSSYRPWYHETWFLMLLIAFSSVAMGLTALDRSKTVYLKETQYIVKGITFDAKKEKDEKANSNRPRR